MSKSLLRAMLVGLGGCLLAVGLLQVAPISISLGQNDKASNQRKDTTLQPGRWYSVYCDAPTTMPSGMTVCSFSSFGTGFEHDGTRKDKDEPCHGPIKMVLRDDGCIEYRCLWCKRNWTRDVEGRLVKDSNGK